MRPLSSPPRLAGRAAALALPLALVAAACTHEPSQILQRRAPRIVGPLHTQGRAFVDATGKKVRLLGVGSRNMAPGSGYPAKVSMAATGCPGWMAPSAEEYSTVARLGFNSVRLAVSWANLEPSPPTIVGGAIVHHAWNLPYLKVLDDVVRSYTDVGIAVVVSMQQYKWSPAFRNVVTKQGVQCSGLGMPTWLYPNAAEEDSQVATCDFFGDRPEPGAPLPSPQAGFLAAWRLLAARYASNPMVVGADVLNEPYATRPCRYPASLHLDALYARAGSAIRSENPHVTLFFEDSQYDPEGHYGLAARPSFGNEAYSFHLYTTDWNPNGLSVMQAFLARARALDLPVWIGEFNRFGQPLSAPPDWPEQLRQMLAYCRANDVSWDYWAYRGVDPLVDIHTHQPLLPLVPVLQEGY